MKPRLPNQKTAAFTLIELLVVITILLIFLAMIDFGPPPKAKRRAQRILCVNNLKQIRVSVKLWEDDGDKYPMQVSVTNGGAMELANRGDVAACFIVMSNQLGTPKILRCPADTPWVWATNFSVLNNSNISYFVGLDAKEAQPQLFLSGDDNFAISGVPVKSGLLQLWTNTPIAWTKERHKHTGNILFADGSVVQTDDKSLVEKLQATGPATNRLAIP